MPRQVLSIALGVALTFPAAAVPLIPISQVTEAGAFLMVTGQSGVVVDLSSPAASDTKQIFDLRGLHAQSAGRSRLDPPPTIAANGSFLAGSFTELDVRASGQATQAITLLAPPGQLTMHFVLPQLLLEFSDTVERLAGGQPIGGDMITQIQASICVRTPGPDGCPFELVATLFGNFTEQELSLQAKSLDPGLDLSAFDGQAPTVAGDFFRQTATWEFPAFEGDLDLSAFAGGELTVTYQLVAIAEGRADITTAAAAINDPFFFETDPTAVSPLTFDVVAADADPSAVPAPGGFGLLAMALCGWAATRRRSA